MLIENHIGAKYASGNLLKRKFAENTYINNMARASHINANNVRNASIQEVT